MAKYKIVHYLNQFFGGIGGEEKAGFEPEVKKEKIGPGLALVQALGEDYDIAATVICGDNYFGENLDAATETIIEMVKKYEPDVFVAGPAFNAGRYGVACGTICKAVEERLGIPVLTGMYEENPGADMFKKDVITVQTGNSAATLRKSLPKFVNLIKKMATEEEILGPSVEGYLERGIRVNYFADKRGATRGMDMLIKKMAGDPFETDLPMPKFDRVPPADAITDIRHAKIAVVTSGGVVPQGNPDHIESSNATKYGVYSIDGMDSMSPEDFTTIHGGYDRQFVMKNPNLVVPLDVLRELEKDGEFGELVNYFCTTTGTGTATGSAAKFGDSIGRKFVDEHVDGVILVST
jgi:glycine/betaine/sarcosine/D-proline reductase family selenoprotein B